MTIGERIKKIRTNLHISQAELARRMGVKQQAVSQFEKSDNLKYETIKKISDALDVSLSSFLDDEIFNAIDSDDASAETKILNKRSMKYWKMKIYQTKKGKNNSNTLLLKEKFCKLTI